MPKPGFYGGVKDTAHRASVPDEPDLPLCWMPMDVDNSSGGQAWVQGDRWGPLQGRLLVDVLREVKAAGEWDGDPDEFFASVLEAARAGQNSRIPRCAR